MTDDQLFDIPQTKPKMAPAKFIGGPLDGRRQEVPEYGPACIRWWEVGSVSYYTIKRGTKRTYTYAGKVVVDV